MPGRGGGERRGGRAAGGRTAGGRGLAARSPVQVPPPDIRDGLQFSAQLTLQQLLLPAPTGTVLLIKLPGTGTAPRCP